MTATKLLTRAKQLGSGDLVSGVAHEPIRSLTAEQDVHGALVADVARQRGVNTFLQQNEALLHRRDRRDAIAAISVSIFVAIGHEDALCPLRIHEDLATRIAGAQFVVVEEAGHLVTIDQPESLTGALSSWLSTCQGTTIIH